MARAGSLIVNGRAISAEVQEEVEARMQRTTSFKARDVERWLIELGVEPRPQGIARWEPNVTYRAADRLLQRARRAGKVIFRDGVWGPTQ